MDQRVGHAQANGALSPYRYFTRNEWAALACGHAADADDRRSHQASVDQRSDFGRGSDRDLFCRSRDCSRSTSRRRKGCSRRRRDFWAPRTARFPTLSAWPAPSPSANRRAHACCRRSCRAGRIRLRFNSSRPTVFFCPTRSSSVTTSWRRRVFRKATTRRRLSDFSRKSRQASRAWRRRSIRI